jgi:hypothetical protein
MMGKEVKGGEGKVKERERSRSREEKETDIGIRDLALVESTLFFQSVEMCLKSQR